MVSWGYYCYGWRRPSLSRLSVIVKQSFLFIAYTDNKDNMNMLNIA